VRRFVLIGLVVSTSLVAAPVAARASDDSVRQVVQQQAERQTKQDAKFKKAVKTLRTRAQFVKARTATIVQKKSVDTFHDAVQAEQADSEQVKSGRTELLKGLSLYNVGLERFRKALTEAIRTNGRGGVKKAKSALKTLNHAVDMVASGARKIHG
jgi:soluble cytochrome b562